MIPASRQKAGWEAGRVREPRDQSLILVISVTQALVVWGGG